ncbi:MAG: hypothetical protein M3280_05295 [Actinomycetota bacterium]|nr:hypothetical protein [Actinomycetota bacterium]
MAATDQTGDRFFWPLVGGFGAQVAGRLVDLQWHLSHEEFEGAAEQFQAHWLIWLSTLFVLGVAALAVRDVTPPGQRRGYLIVLVANLAYAIVAIAHFFQHLDHREVDWAHLLLAVTSIAAAIGVIWVIAARLMGRRGQKEAVA